MSNETDSYECEYCGTEFESGPKKAGHISQNHRDDKQRDCNSYARYSVSRRNSVIHRL